MRKKTLFAQPPAMPSSAAELNRREFLAPTAVALTGAAALATSAKADPGPGRIGQVLGRRVTGDSAFKQRAILDYHHNMAPFGGRLSAPNGGLLETFPRGVPWQFEVLIVGSGYGASVSAARIAPRLKPGSRLGVLERGREWVPGTFPDRLPDLLDASRQDLIGKNKGKIRNPAGLFNVYQFEEISILSGCTISRWHGEPAPNFTRRPKYTASKKSTDTIAFISRTLQTMVKEVMSLATE